MVGWETLTLALLAVGAQSAFFGRKFTAEEGWELQITSAEVSAEEAWNVFACDLSCGETCLNLVTDHTVQACIGFCGCAALIEVPSKAGTQNQLKEECPVACETLCAGSKQEHCLEDCQANFCGTVPSYEAISYYIGAALEAVGLVTLFLLLRICCWKMESKRRRRIRLAEESEGTYRML